MRSSLIATRALVLGYGEQPVVRGIDFALAAGEFVAVVGPNGSGKSTWMKGLVGYLTPQSGEVLYGGRSLRKLKRPEAASQVAFVPQSTSFHFPYRVLDYVLLGRHPHQGLFRFTSAEDRVAVEEAMRQSEVWELRDRTITELSGGERQRVVLAAALAQGASALLLDEPTNSLDLRSQLKLYELLSQLKKERALGIVSVSHDINLAAAHADRIVVLDDGRIVADGTPEDVVTEELLRQHFGVEARVMLDEEQRPYAVARNSVRSA